MYLGEYSKSFLGANIFCHPRVMIINREKFERIWGIFIIIIIIIYKLWIYRKTSWSSVIINREKVDLSHMSAARHKINANYGNLASDKVEKRVAKNLFYDSMVKRESLNKLFATLFYTLSDTKFS